jgi:uncharacterized protein with FMN-binding domain
MSAQTKIVVLRMKTVIYTGLLAVLAIFLIVMLILMFSRKSSSTTQSSPDVQDNSSVLTQSDSIYTPGRYSACLMLNGEPVELIVTVDNNHINGINFCQLSETVTASYPLIEPALDSLSQQIVEMQSIENLEIDDSMKYTQNALIDTIKTALHKASIDS